MKESLVLVSQPDWQPELGLHMVPLAAVAQQAVS